MSDTDETSVDELICEVRKRRDCGTLHAGVVDVVELEAVASTFGLTEQISIYRKITRDEAARVLVSVLHQDLAYGSEIMPLWNAELLARELLDLVPEATLYTNGSFGDPPIEVTGRVQMGASWNPATTATFDTGVIALGRRRSLCVWVEDED